MSAHATIQTTKDRSNPLEPSIRDGLLAATPSLRAFAMSLSGNLDRADDLVQDTLLRAIANIELFRKRIREVEDTDGSYVGSLKSSPQQHSQVEFEEFRRALVKLIPDQREALILVGASGFSCEEAAAICGCAVGTIKSRVHRARTKLVELLSIDSSHSFGPDQPTQAIMTVGARG